MFKTYSMFGNSILLFVLSIPSLVSAQVAGYSQSILDVPVVQYVGGQGSSAPMTNYYNFPIATQSYRQVEGSVKIKSTPITSVIY